jgi:hypothetical protein
VRHFRTQEKIIQAFERLERASTQLHRSARELARLIETDPNREWPATWDRFIAAGGLTCDELCRWIVNQQQQIRPTVRRQHLRLVAGAGKPHLRPQDGPKEAA